MLNVLLGLYKLINATQSENELAIHMEIIIKNYQLISPKLTFNLYTDLPDYTNCKNIN